MRGKANNFDALRLIAAMLVVLSHMAAISGREEWLAVADQTWGALGVLVFFSISGYLVTSSWRADPDLGRFLAKRFLRIAPGLLVAVTMTYLAVTAMGLSGFPGNPLHLLNGSLWTIEFEVKCYLLLVALMLAVKHPAVVGVAASVVAYLIWPTDYLAGFAPFFAVGALIAAYPILSSGRATSLLIAFGAAIFLHRHMLGLALIVPAVSVWLGTRSWPVLRDVPRLGDLSYGVYIYAWPVQQVVVAYMGASASYWALLLVTLAALLPLAYGSWRLVEQPSLARKPLREPGRLRVSENAGIR